MVCFFYSDHSFFHNKCERKGQYAVDELGKYVSGESDLALDRMQSVRYFDREPGEGRNVVMWPGSLQAVGKGRLPIQLQ